MAAVQDEEVAQSLLELLAIAKMRMPDLLYENEPRIHRAHQLAATLCQGSGSRSTSALAELSDESPTLNLEPPPSIVEQLHEPEPPPWDITAGLDAFVESDFAPKSRTEGTISILRDWLIGHGYIEAPPEPEEAH
jgi:hypothetical protein